MIRWQAMAHLWESTTGPSVFLFAIREGQDRPLFLKLTDCFFALLPQLDLVKHTSSACKP